MTIHPLKPFPPPPHISTLQQVGEHFRRMYEALQPMRAGHLECVAEFTVTANVASSVFTDYRLSAQSVIHFDPKTANAATELANGTIYALTANRGNGAWTITHANNAQADRIYQVSIIG